MKPPHCQSSPANSIAPRPAMERQRQARNLGPKTWSRMVAAGILDLEDLREQGAVTAYVHLKKCFPDEVSLNALWAMQAALLDCDWRDLPGELKARLKSEVQAHTDQSGYAS